MSAKKPADEKIANIPPFGLRMLPDLKDRISQAADANGRSMNAEIVARLERSFEADGVPSVEVVQLKPIGLSRSNAAAILGLSIEAFDLLVEQGELPRPKQIGPEMIWPRELIEMAANRWLQVDLFGGSPADDAERQARHRARMQQKLHETKERNRKKRQAAEAGAANKPKSA